MSAKLYVLSGNDLGAVYEVEEGSVIGRAADCDVRLVDASISRKHARIERSEGGWVVVDLGSRNGVFGDGERLDQVALADRSEFVLGDVQLRFRELAPAAEPPAAAPRSMPGEPARPVAAAPTPGRASAEGLELEEDIDLDALAESPPPVERAQRAAAPAPAPDSAAARRAEILRTSERRGSVLTDALEDRPLWLSALLFLAMLGLAGGLAYGVFRLVVGARGG